MEKEIFACIITNLFNEYHHHLKYPIKELMMTGHLVGVIINKKLLDSKPLQMAF